MKEPFRIEDYNLWMRTFSKYHFYNIAEPLMFYRVSGLPYLDKYLLSMKGERKELRKHKEIIPQLPCSSTEELPKNVS